MDSQWRNFSLAFTLAAAVVTPAFGQSVAPTVGPSGSEEESAASLPDFSGIWVHSIPGFEPLRSGPTALVNRSRRENGTGDILKLTGDYTNPILKPEAAEVVKSHAELGLNGIGDPNPRIQCRPAGVPFVFTNGPTQLLQQPDKVTILYGYDHQVRRVRLNQPHPAQVTPSWYGDSVGHYEGDSLVIDTVGVKVGQYSMVDWYGQCCSTLFVVVHIAQGFEASEGSGVAILGDGVGLIEPQDIISEAAQSGEDARVAADARGIFAEGDVADVVLFVFDTPMFANGIGGLAGTDGAIGQVERGFA